jgi:hypothetical protein
MGWRRSDEQGPEPTVLSSAARHGPIRPRDAVAVISEAERSFKSCSARHEYCKAKGVDYERSLVYIPIIESLERSMEADDVLRRPPLWPPLPNIK